jgi:hypothetical protein
MITADDARVLAQGLEENRELWTKVHREIAAAAINGKSYVSIAFTNPEDAGFVFERIWAFGFETTNGIGVSYIDNKPVKWRIDISWKKKKFRKKDLKSRTGMIL